MGTYSDKKEYIKNAIINLLRSTKREGIENVINYLNKSGFFIVPSSKDRHHNWEGGLAEHSFGVYQNAVALDDKLPRDSVILCGLLHDICKAAKLYGGEDGLFHRRKTHIRGHGYRSIRLLESCGLKLTEEERMAIRWHMGGHHAEGEEIEEVYKARQSRLWHIIHRSDYLDASGKSIKLK